MDTHGIAHHNDELLQSRGYLSYKTDDETSYDIVCVHHGYFEHEGQLGGQAIENRPARIHRKHLTGGVYLQDDG